MPVKLIGTIILLIAVTVFAGSNLDNKCDINLVFYKFEQIPVFMTVIASFAFGAILMLPFTFRRYKASKKTEEAKKENNTGASSKVISNKEDTESKTLFDFKIKKETPKTDNSGSKSFFSKKEKSSAETAEVSKSE